MAGCLIQDVAVKVFLDQDLKVEALEEFKSEVGCCTLILTASVTLFRVHSLLVN